MTELPNPITRDHSFFAVIIERLDWQNQLLADLCDRLPGPVAEQEPGPADEVQLTEPDIPPDPGDAVSLAEPEQPTRRPSARKPAAKKPSAPRTTRGRASTKES